jgi:hypothetical protein
VSERTLCATLVMLFGQGRLKFAAGMPLVDVLVKEIPTIEVRITPATGNEVIEAPAGEHDDMAMALALCCWWGERSGPPAAVADFSVPLVPDERNGGPGSFEYV